MNLKSFKGRLVILACSVFIMSFIYPQKKIGVYLVGDSTMSEKKVTAYPETGWGMPFAYFFSSEVKVENRAQNGRSTRTFIEEQRWKAVADSLEQGDYVLIQFGHNDEVPTKKSYTPPSEFRSNLERFIRETKNKGATPVLITPVARRKFDDKGNIEETHEVYSAIVRQVASENRVPLIDLDKRSQEMLQRLGSESSRWLFNYLEPGEHPNYPEGKKDDTHFNELGARKMAELVLEGLKEQKLPLVNHLVKN